VEDSRSKRKKKKLTKISKPEENFPELLTKRGWEKRMGWRPGAARGRGKNDRWITFRKKEKVEGGGRPPSFNRHNIGVKEKNITAKKKKKRGAKHSMKSARNGTHTRGNGDRLEVTLGRKRRRKTYSGKIPAEQGDEIPPKGKGSNRPGQVEPGVLLNASHALDKRNSASCC